MKVRTVYTFYVESELENCGIPKAELTHEDKEALKRSIENALLESFDCENKVVRVTHCHRSVVPRDEMVNTV